MKRVVSVSLGSPKRDHTAQIEFLGETVVLERVGTGGDIPRALRLIRELDGKVDAFGMGGIDLYIFVGGRRYTFRDGKRIKAAARRTPMVDGSGLKNTLERQVVRYLSNDLKIPLQGMKVFMVAAVDRFGMAEALVDAGCEMVFGDLMFGLGIPLPIRSLRGLARVARVLAPVVTQLPFNMLYPTGERQEVTIPKHTKYFEWAEMVAGDFNYIKRHMPPDLTGKIILTNTVTPGDVAQLKQRGVSRLITTTPDLGGRSFGTNVIEAMLVAIAGKKPEDMRPEDYQDLLGKIGFRPRVLEFQDVQPRRAQE